MSQIDRLIGWLCRHGSKLFQRIALSIIHSALQHLPNNARYSFVLSTWRAIMNCLSGEMRKDFVKNTIAASFGTEPDLFFQCMVNNSIFGQLQASQRQEIFVLICRDLTAANTPQAYIDAFETATGGRLHYSQEGEDIVLLRFPELRASGFFVDVGAHHATRFSNTFALYRRGWHGVNIDATPNSMKSFAELRPRDINLERAISDKAGPLVFNVFHEGALNTFNSALAESYKSGGFELQETVELTPCSLADVLDRHVPEGQHIDLLSIDVEGEELGVLRSNNWEKYCPDVIIIEFLETSLVSLQSDPAVVFLAEKGFVPVARLTNSIILRRVASACAA